MRHCSMSRVRPEFNSLHFMADAESAGCEVQRFPGALFRVTYSLTVIDYYPYSSRLRAKVSYLGGATHKIYHAIQSSQVIELALGVYTVEELHERAHAKY